MALDAETIGALTEELDRKLRDGRIEKVQQPEKDLLLLTVRTLGENRKVLIRAAGPNARMHLTEQSFRSERTGRSKLSAARDRTAGQGCERDPRRW